ncbi:tryptophanase family protein [Campylobacter blaseri]|uniref:Tryptophanase n=1 Tax=Campylobacter blaseri TaxID=2042961 RepID=A0A2P8R2F4_9BACT|nr:tryptophanase [Campylobacter blaseri]PSM52677.1 tryptophanase [Campylobacter blaseri]PSM54325.1 tryptophanase [Campylobacter blaseri]QKF85977.1 tryptophanase family protein [Campylobacter blaseri]
MKKVKFFSGEEIPLEFHKVRVVQKLNLQNIDRRLEAIKEAGNNTFLLKNQDIFLDMLTDSGVNAMSDNQVASMLRADDSYAGSQTFSRLEKSVKEFFNKRYFLPVHQGRAAENIISKAMVKENSSVITNYHFTTSRAHVMMNGGDMIEAINKAGIEVNSNNLFKGNMDIELLTEQINKKGSENISFVRMEAGTNLIGGQPFSIENLKNVKKICNEYEIPLVLDASLLSDNLYFIKTREERYKNSTIKEILNEISNCCDVIYFSARKLSSARGGGICFDSEKYYYKMRELLTLYEGFLTYGGMSVREMEAIAVGLEETLDFDNISQGPEFIKYMTDELVKANVPVVTPAGGLGCHIDAMEFVSHIKREEYRAGSLASALYIVSGCRGMERGTISEERNPDGSEHISDMELLRMAMPRRVFTLSQVKFIIDRIIWLHKNKELIGGLKFIDEPSKLRFFLGKLAPTSNWQEELVRKFKQDFGNSL